MKIMLSGLDRIMIPSLMPERADKFEQLLSVEIEKIIGMSSDEFSEYGFFINEEKKTAWDSDSVLKEKEFELSDTHISFLKKRSKELHEARELTRYQALTCDKIDGIQIEKTK